MTSHYVDDAEVVRTFREEVRGILADPNVQRLCAEIDADSDPLPLMRVFGDVGLLAPHLPHRYGGRGAPFRCTLALLEELSPYCNIETAHLLSAQVVASVISAYGNEAQKVSYLRPLARAEWLACVLYTELQSGSSLSDVCTELRPKGGGTYALTGQKVYCLKAHLSRLGLCSAHVPTGPSSRSTVLVLVDLVKAGVSVEPHRGPCLERFNTVRFEEVEISQDSIIGGLQNGYGAVLTSLMYERTGFDFYLKAARWTRELLETTRDPQTLSVPLHLLGRTFFASQLAKLNAERGVQEIESQAQSPVQLLCSKIASSQQSQQVAMIRGGFAIHGCGNDTPQAAQITALADGFSTTISAGPTEALLEALSSSIMH
ncbi:MAG: acyl-CoA/acyl-ACP dehydrogenase [Acetobacteraceae bacterium]|nr:acyl-CoA/acyl-ACP dehydrogenase [Acetobacteraceae bacterium]